MNRFENHAIIPLEWFYEVLEKRLVKLNLKIKDLFLCVPSDNEADTIYDIPYKEHLHYLSQDLWKVLARDNKLRVFFIKKSRLDKIYLCHKSKFSYPHVGTGSVERAKISKEEVKVGGIRRAAATSLTAVTDLEGKDLEGENEKRVETIN